jgi:hypothetical protein
MALICSLCLILNGLPICPVYLYNSHQQVGKSADKCQFFKLCRTGFCGEMILNDFQQ